MTYAELREFILLALELDPATTNDHTVDLVNYHIRRVLQELLVDVRPLATFVEAGPVAVTSATTSIALGSGGFGVSNLGAISGLAVDIGDGIKDGGWTPVSWQLWNGVDESQLIRRWSFDAETNFYLSNWPESGETWNVYLRYHRLPVAMADGAEPEIPVEHQMGTLVPGVIISFPHRFVGAREVLLATYAKQFAEGKKRLLYARKVMSHRSSFRPSPYGLVSSSESVFPEWQTT